MDYSDFIENYNNENINLFEKTLLIINRTRDIYNGKAVTFENKKKYRALDCAIYEINKENIHPDFTEILDTENIIPMNDETTLESGLLSEDESNNENTEASESDELLSQIKIDYEEE